MTDYDPSKWKSTKRGKRYNYLMRFNEESTIKILSGMKVRMIDRQFYKKMKKKGRSWYWGWIAFNDPLPLFDAMEAGLVPTFRTGVRVNEA